MDTHTALIRHKNQAGRALTSADFHIARRLHTAGSIPPSWAARRAELAREYTLATEALDWWRRARQVELEQWLDAEARRWVESRGRKLHRQLSLVACF